MGRWYVGEVELSEPLPMIAPSARGGPMDRSTDAAWLLIRLHGRPLGAITVPLDPDGRLTAPTLAEAIDAALGPAVARHLRDDGLPHETVGPEGLTVGTTPACRRHQDAVLGAQPSVSVIVPCADRPDLLRRTVLDLLDQSLPPGEVVVVDNAPGSSGAPAAVRGLGTPRSPVRLVIEPEPGSSPARNRGAAAATGAILAFIDGDVRADRDWLLELVAPMVLDATVSAASGSILPLELETPAQRWMEAWGGYSKGFAPWVVALGAGGADAPLFPYAASLGSGQSMAVRAEVFRSLGGFDRSLGVRTPAKGGEDLALLYDVVRAGGRLAYAPASIVWHPHPRTARAFLDKLHDYGIGLTAHLARTIVRRPIAALEIGLRVPAALAYFFRAGSDRNRGRGPGYPALAVRRAELSGMALGPARYLASRLTRAGAARHSEPG